MIRYVNIRLTETYKAVTAFDWENIPEFVVVTGKNGTGKSQLLNLINNSIKKPHINPVVAIEGVVFKPSEVILIQGNWNVNNNPATGVATRQGDKERAWSEFQQFQRNDLSAERYRLHDAFNELVAASGKHRQEITREDFFKLIPDIFIMDENHIFNENVSNIFYTYYLKHAQYRFEKKSDEQFMTDYGRPPWVIFEEILKTSNLEFTFNNPSENSNLEETYYFRLTNKNGQEIAFSELSSGEKVLMSLVCWLFNAKELKFFPKLLLLDEPDAHLHPSMTKQFLDVVHEVLVQKNGIRVIMTTHSPSTVALAPEDSLFEMSFTEPRLAKSPSQNHTISLLTSGLVIVGKGTKFVLVEGETDVDFYSEVFKDLVAQKKMDGSITIVFISATTPSQQIRNAGGGGRKEVEKWTEKFQESDHLKSIFHGLTDSDAIPSSVPGVISIERYCMENYLIDPLVIYAALISGNRVPRAIDKEIASGNEVMIKGLPIPDLQSICDYIISAVESRLPSVFTADKTMINVSFVNGFSLKYPQWFLNKSGKDILAQFKQEFPSINEEKLLKAFKKLQIFPDNLVSILKGIQLLPAE